MARPRLGDLIDAAIDRARAFGTDIELVVHRGDVDIEISGISSDSRDIVAGMVYCAIVGETHDGHDFIDDAVQRGAAAVLMQRPVASGVCELLTDDVRKTMPWLASCFWGNPSDSVPTVGVTGTNGKTTITTMLGHIATVEGRGGTVIGTLTGALTTPEAPALQAKLADAVNRGHRLAAMEVSSHALDQHRADATAFAVGVFTNLTTDHLDYHETMEQYFEAKSKLFDGRSRHQVIVVADPWGERLAESTPTAVLVRPDAIAVESVRADGSSFVWRDQRIDFGLVGDFNITNAICAAEAARAVGIDDAVIAEGLRTMGPVRGRMDRVKGLPAWSPVVFVDYSHTPDGLDHALRSLRAFTSGRLICVFGAGGDRDATKRPLMGSVAEQSSDITIVTSDNPRSEDPQVIIEHVLAGMVSPEAAMVESDRRAAIALALATASTDDVVLVAGRGHEKKQKMKDSTVDFDDAVVVGEEAQRLATAREGDC